jgi:hypothetical protein
MDTKILKLIKVVNDNYNHIQQLQTLAEVLKEKYPEEHVVTVTTINSHYEYGLFGHKKFQHPENHIDSFFVGKNVVDKPLVAGMDDREIFYPQKPGATKTRCNQRENRTKL